MWELLSNPLAGPQLHCGRGDFLKQGSLLPRNAKALMKTRAFDLRSQDYKRDPYPTLARLVAEGPVLKIKYPIIGSVWTATSYEAVNELLRDRQTFVRDPRTAGLKKGAKLPWWIPRSMRAMAETMINRDEPDHRRLRGLVEQAFLRSSIQQLRPRFESIATEMIDVLEHQQRRTGQPVDLVAGLARPFPLAVICELLGLPQADRPLFVKHAEAFAGNTSWYGIFKLFRYAKRLMAYIRERIEIAKATPLPGMISELIAAEQQGDRLTEDEMVTMILLLLLAGHLTTVHLIGAGVYTLLDHPPQKQMLLADWSLAGSAIDEILRFVSPVQMTKLLLPARDLQWHGQTVKRGERMIAYLAAANVDPRQFEDPERFDILRQPNPHVAFGAGTHICLGLKLAVAEAEIALRQLFTRFPNMELGIPREQVRWSRPLGTRGLESMPVRLRAPSN